MKQFLFLSMIILSGLNVHVKAQTIMAVPDGKGGTKTIQSPPPDNDVTIKFKSMTINYGKIAYNSNGVRYFQYTNTGTKPLIISHAVSSCGCTVPTWDKKPLKAGGSSKLMVKYDTQREGIFEKHVEVLSNASNQKVTLIIKGEVMKKPSAVPKTTK